MSVSLRERALDAYRAHEARATQRQEAEMEQLLRELRPRFQEALRQQLGLDIDVSRVGLAFPENCFEDPILGPVEVDGLLIGWTADRRALAPFALYIRCACGFLVTTGKFRDAEGLGQNLQASPSPLDSRRCHRCTEAAGREQEEVRNLAELVMGEIHPLVLDVVREELRRQRKGTRHD